MIILKVFFLHGFFSLIQPHTIFMPNLPMGEYRTVYEKVYPCDSNNNTLQFNCFLSKKTVNTFEFKGNITLFKPLDDAMKLDVNLASWGLTGGWKPNSMVYVSNNACSNMKKVFGKAWFSLMKGYNLPTSSCPLPAGTYMTSGIDVKELEDHNFPKVYFYGKYKVVIKIKSENNNVLGCVVLEISLTRPWEKPI